MLEWFHSNRCCQHSIEVPGHKVYSCQRMRNRLCLQQEYLLHLHTRYWCHLARGNLKRKTYVNTVHSARLTIVSVQGELQCLLRITWQHKRERRMFFGGSDFHYCQGLNVYQLPYEYFYKYTLEWSPLKEILSRVCSSRL